jgi:hypothetical protein
MEQMRESYAKLREQYTDELKAQYVRLPAHFSARLTPCALRSCPVDGDAAATQSEG